LQQAIELTRSLNLVTCLARHAETICELVDLMADRDDLHSKCAVKARYVVPSGNTGKLLAVNRVAIARGAWYLLRWIGGTSMVEDFLTNIVDAWQRRTILAKLFSFASIGVVNVAVDVTIFAVAYKLAGLPLVLSNVIAWLVAVTGSYAMNTKITFGRETGGVYSLGRYVSFAASGIVGLLVATTALVILSRYADVPVAKLASIVVALGVNFSASHLLVFRMPRIS
jgi:putative flippase GtrA